VVEIPKERIWSWHKRKRRRKEILSTNCLYTQPSPQGAGSPLDNIDFRGLTQDEVVGQNGLIKQLTGKILQRALEAEMTEHLGYEKNSNSGDNSGNSRNGHTEKTVLLENQNTTIEVPRDRNGTFEPVIVPKHEKRVPLFNDQIISMYSFGMSGHNIQKHLEQVYNVEVSPDLISRVTNEVIEEVREWQNRR
jgi:transposase-like protein